MVPLMNDFPILETISYIYSYEYLIKGKLTDFVHTLDSWDRLL